MPEGVLLGYKKKVEPIQRKETIYSPYSSVEESEEMTANELEKASKEEKSVKMSRMAKALRKALY